ncbi:MAG: thioredoxin [Anaerolineales bacterium]|nr:thioredoxin [Anaerolineales bacterium]MCB0007856.1 thioredoxin [Anaerolineales bacterium]MCB0013263.1 thioredoxin [Anaerolineales bacterium]MCB0029756.1 thioredoxin [Anaerolineales bacterium]MCB8959155.1 thioredoxin [Ardenticatenales bacterium]
MANSSNVIDVNEGSFEQDVIQRSANTLVVVDFWAPWCGPCRMLGPVLEKLANEPGSNFVLAKVNSDNNQNLSWRYQVRGIPAVKAFKDGKVVGEFVGARPEPMVRDFIQGLVGANGGESDLDVAQEALEEMDWAAAEAGFRAILDEAPEHRAGLLGLSRALLAQGHGCEPERLLKLIKSGPEFVAAEKLTVLARYLCSAEEEWTDEDEITPLEAQYRHVARLLSRGNVPAALDGLLDVLRANKQYRKGQARELALSLIALLGEKNKLAAGYRSELAMVLY